MASSYDRSIFQDNAVLNKKGVIFENGSDFTFLAESILVPLWIGVI
jgi:hypothetical protein